jgi:ATP-binding cassette subfamily B protein IrtB
MINYTEMRYALISGERIMEIRNQPEVQGTEELTEDFIKTRQ